MGADDIVVDTLETGVIRTMNPAEPVAVPGGPVELEPLFRVGTVDGPEVTRFSTISDLEADADGRLYVLDRQAAELRIFEADGEPVGRFGGPGEGPGEFMAPNGIRWLTPGGSLVIIDQSGGRYSIMTSEGDFVRSVRRDLGYFGWVFEGGVADGRVSEVGPVRLDSEGGAVTAAIVSIELRDPEGTAARDTLHIPPTDVTPADESETFSIRTDQGGMTMAVPFSARAIRRFAPDGTLWQGHGSALTLHNLTLEGEVLREIHGSLEAHPVAQEELDEWLDGDGVARFRELGGDLDLDRIPSVKPHFDRIFVADDGYIWLSVPVAPEDSRLLAFDPDGRFAGDFHLPGIRRHGNLGPVIRGDRLFLPALDDFDVEGVEVFRIVR